MDYLSTGVRFLPSTVSPNLFKTTLLINRQRHHHLSMRKRYNKKVKGWTRWLMPLWTTDNLWRPARPRKNWGFFVRIFASANKGGDWAVEVQWFSRIMEHEGANVTCGVCRGFRKWWYPQVIQFYRVFHDFHHPFWDATILGNPHVLPPHTTTSVVKRLALHDGNIIVAQVTATRKPKDEDHQQQQSCEMTWALVQGPKTRFLESQVPYF